MPHVLKEAALCGVHCLNNLLQGPYFGATDLMEIALQLDAQERSLMAELGTETDDFQKFSRVRNSYFVIRNSDSGISGTWSRRNASLTKLLETRLFSPPRADRRKVAT